MAFIAMTDEDVIRECRSSDDPDLRDIAKRLAAQIDGKCKSDDRYFRLEGENENLNEVIENLGEENKSLKSKLEKALDRVFSLERHSAWLECALERRAA